jgi:hypothetical protein
MDHYIAHHSVDLMGREYRPTGPDFGHYSRKPETFLQRTIGNLVWVVVGKRSGKRTRSIDLPPSIRQNGSRVKGTTGSSKDGVFRLRVIRISLTWHGSPSCSESKTSSASA